MQNTDLNYISYWDEYAGNFYQLLFKHINTLNVAYKYLCYLTVWF